MWFFILGFFVGGFLAVLVLSLCNMAASADHLQERMTLERHEREKAEAEDKLRL